MSGIDDRILSLKPYSPVCGKCKHLRSMAFHTCDAFPEEFPNGIPDDIWEGEDDHTKPRDGDHGIRFEPIEG